MGETMDIKYNYTIFTLIVVGAICLFAGLFFGGVNNTMLATLPADEPVEDCNITNIKEKELNILREGLNGEKKYSICLSNLMEIVVEYDINRVRTYDKNIVECWKRCND